MFTFYVAFVLLVGTFVHAEEAKYLCPASEVARFDSITTRVISFTPQQRKFPAAKEAIAKFCTEIKKDVNDANEIVQKCFTGSAKQFSTIIMYSVKKTVNLYCSLKSKKRHESLIEMSKCVTKNEREIRKCLNIFDNQLIRGKRAEPQNTRIGYACCNYYKLMNCLENATKQTCTAKATDTIQEFVRNLFQSIVDVACGGFEEHSDRCEKLKTPPKKSKSDVAEAKTFFMPLVELFNAL